MPAAEHQPESLDNAPLSHSTSSNEKITLLNNETGAAALAASSAAWNVSNNNEPRHHHKLLSGPAAYADTDDTEGLDDLVNQNQAAASSVTSSADNTPGV